LEGELKKDQKAVLVGSNLGAVGLKVIKIIEYFI
jgi:hypothetical protein